MDGFYFSVVAVVISPCQRGFFPFPPIFGQESMGEREWGKIRRSVTRHGTRGVVSFNAELQVATLQWYISLLSVRDF